MWLVHRYDVYVNKAQYQRLTGAHTHDALGVCDRILVDHVNVGNIVTSSAAFGEADEIGTLKLHFGKRSLNKQVGRSNANLRHRDHCIDLQGSEGELGSASDGRANVNSTQFV